LRTILSINTPVTFLGEQPCVGNEGAWASKTKKEEKGKKLPGKSLSYGISAGGLAAGCTKRVPAKKGPQGSHFPLLARIKTQGKKT